MPLSFEEYKKQRLEEGKTRSEIQRGFKGELLPTIGAVGGGIIGGIVGAPAGGVGAIPGAITGSAIGGAGGEFLQQKMEKISKQREEFNLGQIAATGITAGALEAGTAGLGIIAKPAIKMVREPFVKFVSKLSGYTSDIIEKAMARTPGVIETLKGGEKSLTDIVKRASIKFHSFAKEQLFQSRTIIDKLDKEVSNKLIGISKKVIDVAKESSNFPQFAKNFISYSSKGQFKFAEEESIKKAGFKNLNDFYVVVFKEAKEQTSHINKLFSNITSTLRNQFNIGIEKTGKLLFGRGKLPSRIVSSSEQNAIQEAWNWTKNLEKNISIKQIDATLERLIVLSRKTPAGTPTGAETKSIINQMIGGVKNLVDDTYPKYATQLKESFDKRIFINEAKELLGDTANLTAKEISLLTTRFYQLYNTGKLASRELLEKTGEKIGEDITGAAAGALMKAGEQFSIRAPQLTKRGLVVKMIEGLPRKALSNFAKTGKITGELLNNPKIKMIGKITGLSGKGLLMEIASLLEEKTTD